MRSTGSPAAPASDGPAEWWACSTRGARAPANHTAGWSSTSRAPAPEPQYRVPTPDRRFLGRCDFGWPALGVLAEFDGKKKYGRLLREPGQTAEDVLIEEKRREDRLRALGWIVIRWMWRDLYRPDALITQLRDAFAIGRPLG
jgi:hypothetical protein